MKVTFTVAWFFSFFVLLSVSAIGGSADQSIDAVAFFKVYCANTILLTNDRRIDEAKRASLHRLRGKNEIDLLKGESGSVWTLNASTGELVLVFRGVSGCEVWAHEIDGRSLLPEFDRVLLILGHAGLIVDSLPIRYTESEVGPIEFYDYKVHESGAKFGNKFSLQLSFRSHDYTGILSVDAYKE